MSNGGFDFSKPPDAAPPAATTSGFDFSKPPDTGAPAPQKKIGSFPDFPLSPALKSAREQAIFNEAKENTRRIASSPGARGAMGHEAVTLGGRLAATGAGAAAGAELGLPGMLAGGLTGWFGSGALMSPALKEQLAQEKAKFPEQVSNVETGLTTPALVQLGAEYGPGAIKGTARGIASLAERGKNAIRPGRIVEALGDASDRAAVGEDIRAKLKPELEDAYAHREKQFQQIKDRYMQAGEKQAGEILQHVKTVLKEDYAKLAASGEADDDLRKAYNSVLQSLSPVKASLEAGEKKTAEAGFARLERLRRMLNHRTQTQMKAGEGGKAISANDARTLADHVTNAIDTYLGPVSRGFRSGYKELSRTINEFNETALGKKVSRVESDKLPEVEKIAPDKLGPAFFQSRSGVESLDRLSGGDTAWVQRVARQHAINEIQRIDQDSGALQKWIDSNSIAPNTWLNAPELSGLKAELQQTVRKLKAAETTRTVGAGVGIAGIAGGASAYAKDLFNRVAGAL